MIDVLSGGEGGIRSKQLDLSDHTEAIRSKQIEVIRSKQSDRIQSVQMDYEGRVKGGQTAQREQSRLTGLVVYEFAA